MSNTIGDMVDQLTIMNIRIWFMEDAKRDMCNKHDAETNSELRDIIAKVNTCNRKRNDLVDQINASLRIIVDRCSGESSHLSLNFDDILGEGKNKFYKKENYEKDKDSPNTG